MTPQEFIAALVEGVHDAGVSDIQEALATGPAGRRPQESSVAISAWYRGLSADDKAQVRCLIEMSVHSTLFGVLCVLDGVRTVADTAEFQLFALDGSGKTHLNAPEDEFLHDLYQAAVYERVFPSAK